jgi:hypothetical protein
MKKNFANNYNMADHTIGNYWSVPEPSMRFIYHEHALSEVIGFILILVVVVTAFSIYLTYSIPAQGREKEILHMNEIRDQFVTYKIGVDALWTNSQMGTAMSTTFNLGTQGGATQGSYSFIPILSPVPSSGTLSLNNRQEVLTVQSRSLMRDTGIPFRNQTIIPGSIPVNATPLQLIVNITDSTPTDLTKRYMQLRGVGQDWLVNVTVNPVTTYYEHTVSCPGGICTYQDAYRYNRTDITIDVSKGSVMVLQGFPVYQNIRSATNYSVNLLDDAYGLKNYIQYPATISFAEIDPTNRITSYGIVNISYEQETLTTHSVTLGSLQYYARNNYWIPQTYYYQNGGVFLQQDCTTYKLPPTITFSYDNRTGIIGVKIIELPFQQTNAGNIGGNSPAQVRTQVTNIQNLSYSQTYNNTKWINLSVTTNDSTAAAVWYQYFNDAINITAGVPNKRVNYYSLYSAKQAFMYVNGTGSSAQYDVHVEGLRANLSATIQGG